MKKILLLLSISAFTIVLMLNYSCKGKDKGGSGADSTAVDVSSEEPEIASYCLWKEVSIRDTIGSKGKWLATVYLAEKVEYITQAVDSSDKKLPVYVKIRLIDGKEGWLKSDFVAVNQKIGALTESTPMYSRPTLTSKTDKEFSQMDIVAVVSEQDDWLEVKGKPKGSTWFQTKWIKNDKLTYDKTDLAVAVFALRAFDQKDQEKQKEELNSILENPDFESSMFISEIYNMLNDASMERLEIDFSNFPSSRTDELMEDFAFSEVNLKDGWATIEGENMKDLVNEVVRKLTSAFDFNIFDSDLSRIKINYLSKFYLVLPNFIPAADRNASYWNGYIENPSSESQLLAFLVYRLDRSSSNIKRLYDKYKDYAYNIVDYDMYYSTNIHSTVNDLLITYNYIISFDDYKTKLKDIYNEAKSKNAQAIEEGDEYGYSLDSQWDLYQPIFNNDAEYYDQMWMLSFWVRRFAEDNMETVHSILEDIQNYYSEGD